MKDKYTAIWVSHSSISDYLQCPRLYYLRNIYRDPKTNKKVSLVQPPLALGQTVHDVIDTVSRKPVAERFNEPLMDIFERLWKNIHGQKGGFRDDVQEKDVKARGISMVERMIAHPGPLAKKAVKIRQDLPYYWLSEEDNIILCGKIDWLEYIEDTDSVRIIDFKTGKFDEYPDSLQLPIYHLVVKNTQSRPVAGASYWYLDRDDEPMEVTLPDYADAEKRVLDMAKKIALARKLERFVCKSKDGCRNCRPYEAIIAGKAIHVGLNDFGQDLYVLPQASVPISSTKEEVPVDDMPF